MPEANHQAPGITTLLGRLARTGVGAVQNRLELFAVEWEEERLRLTEVLLWGLALLIMGLMGLLLLTATIVLLFHEELRVYVLGAFAVLYLTGAAAAFFGLKSLVKHEGFTETVAQVKKDRVWLESLK
jgi:uncharacterized membrane protein YqjE